MPTYAVLGATGQTGRELTRFLVAQPSVELHVYARSASRVEALLPELKTAKRAHAHIGDLSDISLLAQCLAGTDAVFSAVAQNANEPTVTIAQRAAHSIVSALERLRDEAAAAAADQKWTCPTVVFLSSASLNPVLYRQSPQFLHWILHQALQQIYEDLARATTYLRSHSWVPLVLAEPGALVHDQSRGVRLSATELSTLLSFADLARGMVMMAEDETWVGQEVAMTSLAPKDVKADGMLSQVLHVLLPGLLCTWLPSVWKVGRSWQWW